jgi:voltage-gated potassium channel
MRENNFAYLLVALTLFLVGEPVMSYMEIIPESFESPILIIALLAIGVWSLSDSKKTLRMGLTLAGVGIAMNVLALYFDALPYRLLSLLTLFLFLALAVQRSFVQVTFSNKLDVNRIYGAICIYLLLGVLWSVAYFALYIVSPDAFAGAVSPEEASGAGQWVYYSFVTLTTLGYGDILPISPPARALAYAEAIFGVFYMAIVVAMVVSAYTAEYQKDNQKKN